MNLFCILFLLVFNSFAGTINLNKESSRKKIQSQVRSQLSLKSETKTLLQLLKKVDPQFDLATKIHSFYKDKHATNELTVSLIFLERAAMLKEDQKYLTALNQIHTEINLYEKLKRKILKEKIEHFYIDRMNCEKSESKCYTLLFTRDMLKYNIPYFDTYNFLQKNLELYFKDPIKFLDIAIDELEIILSPERNFFERLIDRNDDFDEITVEGQKIALAYMLEHLSEFLVDQNDYRSFLKNKTVDFAEKYNIEEKYIIPSDSFLLNSVKVAKGKFDLTPNIHLFISSRPNVLESLDLLIEYLKNVDLEGFSKLN